MRGPIVAILAVLLLAACGSRPVNVEYTPDAESGGSDWYPVPTDRPRTVTSADRVVDRPPVRVEESLAVSDDSEAFRVVETVDSFGNLSLEVNRGASLTWELLDAAVNRLGWSVADRNRSEYRLELTDPDMAGRGFFRRIGAFFTEQNQPVSLILVPKVGATGISAEYQDDQVPSAEENRRLMTQLRDELLQGR